MIEIKNIVFHHNKLNILKQIIAFVNFLLPLRLKYNNESYIALKNNKESALISLNKDSKSYKRFKITKLIMEEYSISTSCQLVNYVISKYRAQGAEAFYVVVDNKQVDLLNIFQNEMNFRTCGVEYLYKINNLNTNHQLCLKPFKQEQIREISKFYNENINSFNRFLFSRENYQFNNNAQKFVFYNENETEILGYFELATKNNLDYYINFTINQAYNIYIIDAIRFIYSKLIHKNKKFNLYVKVKDYFTTSKEILAIFDENNLELISQGQVMAKDYFKEIKEKDLFKNVKIIFNDPTTA